MGSDTLSGNFHVRIAEFGATLAFIQMENPTLQFIFDNLNYLFPRSYTYEFVYPELDEPTSENHNGTWTGTIGMLQRGEADMITFPVTIDEEKLKVVDFLSIRFQNRLLIATKSKTSLQEGDIMDQITRADWKVWILLSISIVLLLSILTLLTYDDNRYTWPRIAHLYLSYMLGEGPVTVLPKLRTRLMAAFFFCFMIILKTCLFADLNTNLVTVKKDTVNSLEELVKHKTLKPVVLNRGGDILYALQNPIVKEYADLMEKVAKDEYGIADVTGGVADLKARFDKILSGDYSVIAEHTSLFVFGHTVFCPNHPNLRIDIASEEIKGSTYGLAVRKMQDDAFKTAIHELSLIFMEAGFVQHIESLLSGQPSCFGEYAGTDVGEPQSLNLEVLRKMFNFLVVGNALSTVVFISELIVGRLGRISRSPGSN